MILSVILGSLAGLSLVLLLWQWLAARRFPLHERNADLRIGPAGDTRSLSNRSSAFQPAITLLKPLKGADAHTESCLRSWFTQDYAGPVQVLLGVHSAEDSAGPVIRKLLAEFPDRDAQLVQTSAQLGTNGKVSNLAQLVKLVKHEVLVISDADVRVPADFLANAVSSLAPQKSANSESEPGRDAFHRVPFSDGKVKDAVERVPTKEVGLVNCFYRLANPTTLPMHLEAIAVNADFWSQVLQSRSLKPLDFALGAVMVTRRRQVEEIGGFEALADCLADDYQLGHRIAKRGHDIVISPVVVECWDPPQTWSSMLKHQLRWARTIRVCQPVPYFFSILSNAGLWAMLWLLAVPNLTMVSTTTLSVTDGGHVQSSMIEPTWAALMAVACCLIRIVCAFDLQRRLTRSSEHAVYFWLVPIKDLLQFLVWVCAFAGNTIEWRGQRFQLRKDGTLVKL